MSFTADIKNISIYKNENDNDIAYITVTQDSDIIKVSFKGSPEEFQPLLKYNRLQFHFSQEPTSSNFKGQIIPYFHAFKMTVPQITEKPKHDFKIKMDS